MNVGDAGYEPTSIGQACLADAARPAPGTIFSPHLAVLGLEREDGPRFLNLPCVLAVVQRWRAAILSQSNDSPAQIRQLLSGHNDDGTPLGSPHMALLPVAFVGQPGADGRLVGMAVSVPEWVSADDRRLAWRVIGRVRRLAIGRLGAWRLTVGRGAAEASIRLGANIMAAHPTGAVRWATVTPIVFDQHAKSRDPAVREREEAAEIVAACIRIGLPAPRDVRVTPWSPQLGVPPAPTFPMLTRKDGSNRRHTHAVLTFDEPVRGPVLIGAGRYRGYGVCRAATLWSDGGTWPCDESRQRSG